MLGNYIEKNILRSVYICEQGFVEKNIKIDKLCEILKVTKITIYNDLKNLKELIPQALISYTIEHDVCTLNFKKDITLQEITKTIYDHSLFLKGLFDCLNGNFNARLFADKEFISLSKAYKLKTAIWTFFEDNNYIIDDQIHLPERDYRLIILSLSSYTSWLELPPIDYQILEAFKQIIADIEDCYFDRKYSSESREYILNGLCLSYLRKENDAIIYPKKDQNEIEINPLYLIIKRTITPYQEILKFHDQELLFVYSIFNSQTYHSPDLFFLQKDFKINFNYFVTKRNDNLDLMNRLTEEFDISSEQIDLFKKSFLDFVRPVIRNQKLILPNKRYLLSEDQKILYAKITQVIADWNHDWQLNVYWNKNSLNKFTLELSLILQKNENKNYRLRIITKSNFNFLYYKSLADSLWTKNVAIDPIMYTNIQSALADSSPNSIIICEESLMLDTPLQKLFPITPHSALKTFLEIEEYYLLHEKQG